MKKNAAYLTIIILTLFVGSGCVEHDWTHYKEFDEDVSNLNVNVDAADVTVSVAKDGVSKVDIDMDYRGSKPKYTVSVNGKTLKVSIDCGFSCDGDIDIKVPAEAAANINLDSGNTTVRNIEGDTTVSVDSGNIKVIDLVGDLDLQTDSGNISGTIESYNCIADTDSGNISLTFEDIPEEIDVSTDSGNIRLEVPEGAYRVSTQVDSGDTDISNILKDSDADSRINAETDSGDIDIIGI